MISSNRRRLLDLATKFIDCASDIELRSARRARLAPLLDAMSNNLFRIVVMGEIKKGKSSFVNALLDEPELLPTAVDVATSTVFKIVHGSAERCTVFFEEGVDGTKKEPLQIDRSALNEFGSEAGNPGNRAQVDFIALELPHPLLADGITIVDTPGVGGLFKKHREITFRYAPQADVVLFVVDSVEAVISRDEIEFIKELRRTAREILFLQTKIDAADEAQVEAWRKRNLEILSNALEWNQDDIPYFLMSSALKQRAHRARDPESLKESGFPDLIGCIVNRLLPRRDEILVRRWLPLLGGELATTTTAIVDRRSIAKQAHLPQMQEYEAELAAAQANFEGWQNEVWPERQRVFNDDVARLKRDIRNRLQDRLSAANRECADELAELRKSTKTVDEVNERGDAMLASWAARWSSDAADGLEGFRREYLKRVEALLGGIAADLADARIPQLQFDPADRRKDATDSYAVVREAAINSSVFGNIAMEGAKVVGGGVGVAMMLGMATGPIALAVAATASVAYVATRIWSAHRGYRAANERQREAAIVILENALGRTATAAQRGAGRAHEELAADLDASVRAAIDEFRKRYRQEFVDRRRSIVEASGRTEAESKAVDDRLKTELDVLKKLLENLRDIKRQVETQAAAA